MSEMLKDEVDTTYGLLLAIRGEWGARVTVVLNET